MEDRLWSISEVNEIVRYLIETAPFLENLQIQGEISNFTRQQQSGHWYFTLKDDQSQLACVCFKGQQAHCLLPKNGDKVAVKGSLTVYKARGQYQLQVHELKHTGMGDLMIAFELLKQKLTLEGLFDAQNKRPIPFLPQKVGIVTSATGAAIQDMLKTLQTRFPAGHVVISPALVQGLGAAESMIAALERLKKDSAVQVVIVGRGGGSIEDLWAFNNENLIRYLAQYPIPIISAVGHETDFTLCDFVADVRAATPTAAAQMVYPSQQELLAWLEEQTIVWKKLMLRQLAEQSRLVDDLSNGLRREMTYKFNQTKQELLLVQANLHKYDVLATLKRGFSITTLKGKPLLSNKGLEKGQVVQTRLADGSFDASII